MTLEDQVRADPRFAAYSPEKQMQLVGIARRKDTHGQPPKNQTRSLLTEALPIGGAILGGTMGGPLGAALGAGIGEEGAQLSEMASGKRERGNIPDILKMAGEQGAMEAVGGPVFKAAGRALKAGGTKLVEATLPRSIYEARLVQSYRAARPFWQRVTAGLRGTPTKAPRTVAQTMVQRGLAGTEAGLGIQAKRATRSLWNDMIQPALRQSKVSVNLPSFFDEIEQGIVTKNPELARQADLVEALQSLRKSYANVSDVPLEQLQKFKHGWAKFVPEKAYLGKPIAGAFNDVKDMAADLARRKIHAALGPELRQAYLDYGNLLAIMEHGKRAMTGGKLRGGFGGFWTAIKDMALTPVSTIGGQVVYKAGNGLELLGTPGARVIRDIIPGLTDVGKSVNDDLLHSLGQTEQGVQ